MHYLMYSRSGSRWVCTLESTRLLLTKEPVETLMGMPDVDLRRWSSTHFCTETRTREALRSIRREFCDAWGLHAAWESNRGDLESRFNQVVVERGLVKFELASLERHLQHYGQAVRKEQRRDNGNYCTNDNYSEELIYVDGMTILGGWCWTVGPCYVSLDATCFLRMSMRSRGGYCCSCGSRKTCSSCEERVVLVPMAATSEARRADLRLIAVHMCAWAKQRGIPLEIAQQMLRDAIG